MIDLPETAPIDAIQIAALRKADRVCFVHDNGRSHIRCIKENKPSKRDPFASEILVLVPCLTTFVSYEDGVQSYPIPDFIGFEMEHCPQSSLEWQTIAGFLKAGDIVILHWCHGAMNTLGTKEIDWVGDYLKLRVVRGDKRFSFHIDQSFVPRHSSARMIRNVRPRETVALVA